MSVACCDPEIVLDCALLWRKVGHVDTLRYNAHWLMNYFMPKWYTLTWITSIYIYSS